MADELAWRETGAAVGGAAVARYEGQDGGDTAQFAQPHMPAGDGVLLWPHTGGEGGDGRGGGGGEDRRQGIEGVACEKSVRIALQEFRTHAVDDEQDHRPSAHCFRLDVMQWLVAGCSTAEGETQRGH